MLTLVVAVGFAVVGIAGAASAHHNTISGKVACASSGGWAVTWTVVNSEQITETITSSNRGVVAVGTQLGARQTKTFTETVTTRPGSPLTLTLGARWSNNTTANNSGSIPVVEFKDDCIVTQVTAPTVPVIDDCGPGNARFDTVPSGPWTSVLNADGSLTVTANQGHRFTDGQSSVTYPTPTDSNQPCPVVTPPVVTPPVVTPPVVTPPVVVTPPEVLPAQVRVIRAAARNIDKCGRASDLFKVAERTGVVYRVNGKVVRQGVWVKAKTRTVTVRATTVDASYALKGKQVWKMTFTRNACAQAPEVSPSTGS
ncbi:hypothetical protein SAMN05192575_106127 [Nocardioides alpinus]|uniref:Uncharacterized protein n=1 Tax=Nocardioides alpinus TaxID=748909 RepID=A0A1I0ZTM6_9ACTN|nr:hypothetical protein [Nocardioides alpinus]SFB27553.1 hypothetical protein SAMN05192575_106127 [Nocardioides alpinus]